MKNKKRIWASSLGSFRHLCVLACFLLGVLNPISAKASYAEQTAITLKLNNKSLKEIFSEIESKTEFVFFYFSEDVNLKEKKSIDISDKSINQVLDQLLADSDYKYKVSNRQVFITREGKETKQSKSDKQKITGTIVDVNNDPIIAASVSIAGSTNATLTDIDGNFSITASVGEMLVVSYIGYQKEQFKIDSKTVYNIVLKEDNKFLDEVVVVGYGTQKRVNLTGAVSHIDSEGLKDRPAVNMTQLIQGQIPNLNVTMGSGKPGEGGALNIRGVTSLNNPGNPLVLIDGLVGDMDRINPNDVESVTVLKDASASAIYGARAAFGVILITTKSAKDGKVRIKYSNNFGWMTHSVSTDFITSGYWNGKINDLAMQNTLGNTAMGYSEEDYEELWARRNDKYEHPDRPWVVIKPDNNGRDRYNYYGNFDWYNYFYSKWRTKSNHNVNITGASGDQKFKYMISSAYATEEGVIRINPDNYDRYNMRVKLDAPISKRLTLSSNTSFFKSKYTWAGKADNFNKVSGNIATNPMYFYHPAYVPFNPDGSYTGSTGKNNYRIGYGNHVSWNHGKSKGKKDDSDFMSSFEAKTTIMDGWTATANFAYRQELSEYMYRQVPLNYSLYPGETQVWDLAELSLDKLTNASSTTKRNMFNIFSNYNKTLGDHTFGATVGFNQEWQKYKLISVNGQELLSEDLNDIKLITTDQQLTGNQYQYAMRGAFMRLNYDYKGRYLAEFSGRYDGSSRFPKEKRFGMFPSFSLGWRLSEENFMDFLKPTFDNIKFRYSYGSLGNQEVGNYGYIESMSVKNSTYLINGDRLTYTDVADAVSRNYTWEKAVTNNIGLDIDMLNSRLSLQSDFYIRQTKDMLTLARKRPATLGTTPPKENAADLETKGFEISVQWRDKFTLANKPFNYHIRAVLSDYTAKITKFDNPSRLLADHYKGKKMGEIWGFHFGGIFQTDEEAAAWAGIVNQDRLNKRRVAAPTDELRKLQAGDIKIWDLDGDGEITFGDATVDNPGDRTVIGNTTPRYSYGVSLGGDWNGIDFSAFFQGIGKRDWYPSNENQMFWQIYARPYGSFIPKNFMKDIWTPDNPDAYFPLARGYIAQNSELSFYNDMYLQNIAYCKLKNITIGYTLPESLLRKTKVISNFRVYLSGENLVTWTPLKSKYIDPESVLNDSSGRTYPMNKTISFGIDVTF